MEKNVTPPSPEYDLVMLTADDIGDVSSRGMAIVSWQQGVSGIQGKIEDESVAQYFFDDSVALREIYVVYNWSRTPEEALEAATTFASREEGYLTSRCFGAPSIEGNRDIQCHGTTCWCVGQFLFWGYVVNSGRLSIRIEYNAYGRTGISPSVHSAELVEKILEKAQGITGAEAPAVLLPLDE